MITSHPTTTESPRELAFPEETGRAPFQRYLATLSGVSSLLERTALIPGVDPNFDEQAPRNFASDYLGSRVFKFIGPTGHELHSSFGEVLDTHNDPTVQAGNELLAAANDTGTPGHEDRVTGLAIIMRDRILGTDAEVLQGWGVSRQELELLSEPGLLTRATAVHDTGKYLPHIQERINLDRELTEDEAKIVATHTAQTAVFLMRHSRWPQSTTIKAINIILPHHFYKDKNPQGRAAEGASKLAAQIISWADQADAISSDMFSGRPYKREPVNRSEAIASLYGQFTGQYRDLFMKMCGFKIPEASGIDNREPFTT
jgi:hypothetical protein